MNIYKKATIIVLLISFSNLFLCVKELKSQSKPPVSITVNTSSVIDPIEPIWNAVGGSLGLALLPQGERLLERIVKASPFPFYRCCYAVTGSGVGFETDYGSTNVYHEDENGNPFYDFTLFDEIFDVIVSMKFIPMMQIGISMPESLSSAPASILKKREIYPPKDYTKWHDLMYIMVTHCIERYGKETVIKWKWEMGNEPDMISHWNGTEEEYFKLYDYTVSAIKSALPEAQVGGNAVTHSQANGTPFLMRFIEHCLRGKNYKDSSVGAPLDFISFHVKATSFDIKKIGNITSEKLSPDIPGFSPSLQYLLESTRYVLEKIASIPGTAGIPVYCNECDIDIGLSISMYENPNVEYRNTEYYPAFQCALAKGLLDVSREFPSNPIHRVSIDALFLHGYRIFEGHRALFTAEEIEKPIFNAFRLLGKLGTERLQFERSENNHVDGLATRLDNSIQVMVYNYNENVDDRELENIELSVILPSSNPYRLTHYRIDENHSNAYSVWKSLGKPLIPNDVQMNQIKSKQGLELYEPEKTVKPKSYKIIIPLELPHHSVSLLVFKPIN